MITNNIWVKTIAAFMVLIFILWYFNPPELMLFIVFGVMVGIFALLGKLFMMFEKWNYKLSSFAFGVMYNCLAITAFADNNYWLFFFAILMNVFTIADLLWSKEAVAAQVKDIVIKVAKEEIDKITEEKNKTSV
jgi:hypothetical protein